MKHFTNKITNEVWGYESLEEAKEFNPDFENLVQMDEKTFMHFRDEKPKGGMWTWDEGWVVDEDKLKEVLQLEQEAHKQNLLQQIQDLNLQIQEHLLMDEKEEAKELVVQKRKLEEELNSM
mgnify:CR=1 FL=1